MFAYARKLIARHAWKMILRKSERDNPVTRYIGGVLSEDAIRDLIALLGTSTRPTHCWIISRIDDEDQGDHALLIDTNIGVTSRFVRQTTIWRT